MKTLIFETAITDEFILLYPKDIDGDVLVEIKDNNGNTINTAINKDNAKQLIDYLKNQFKI